MTAAFHLIEESKRAVLVVIQYNNICFSEYGMNEETINSYVVTPCKRWMQQFSKNLQDLNYSNEIIKSRCNIVTSLHYTVFEHILREERKKKPQFCLEVKLVNHSFIRFN